MPSCIPRPTLHARPAGVRNSWAMSCIRRRRERSWRSESPAISLKGRAHAAVSSFPGGIDAHRQSALGDLACGIGRLLQVGSVIWRTGGAANPSPTSPAISPAMSTLRVITHQRRLFCRVGHQASPPPQYRRPAPWPAMMGHNWGPPVDMCEAAAAEELGRRLFHWHP